MPTDVGHMGSTVSWSAGFAKIFGDFCGTTRSLFILFSLPRIDSGPLFQYLASEGHCLRCCFQCMRELIRDYVMQRIHKVGFQGKQESTWTTVATKTMNHVVFRAPRAKVSGPDRVNKETWPTHTHTGKLLTSSLVFGIDVIDVWQFCCECSMQLSSSGRQV